MKHRFLYFESAMLAGATTGIETIGQNAESKSNVIYDLQGRRVYEPLKSGVYIINGKKVVK